MKKPLHKEAEDFVRHHMGKHVFAPMTGQDVAAWNAFVYLVRTWCVGGGEQAVEAMRETLLCAQPKVWPLFLQAIPAVGDWGHAEQLWPQLVTTRVEGGWERPVRKAP